MGNYPSKRNAYPIPWRARAGATVDAAPLPAKTAARVRGIRQVFLHDFDGYATIDAVGDACEDAGLLESVRTPRSRREAVLEALRPIACSGSAYHPVTVSPASPPGPAGIRLR